MNINAAQRLHAASLTEKAAEFRALLKQRGLKVRTRVAPGGGQVQIIAPSYAEPFTDEQKRTINRMAIDLGYVGVRGTRINVDGGDPHQLDFYPGSAQVTASDYHKLKELAKKFEQQLAKEGAKGVEVTFISDDEINIFSEDKHAFDKAKQVLKKVPGLTFKNEEVDNDPDFDGPHYHAWYKF